MLENKKKRSVLSFLIILNFILIIMRVEVMSR